MIKIKDRILLGIVSGIIASTPAKLINAFEQKKGLTVRRYNQIPISLFTQNKVDTSKKGNFLAAITNHVNSAAFGVFVTYLFSVSGRDNAALKGMGAAALGWITVNGLIGSQLLKQKSKNPIPPILSFFDHIMNGGLCGILVSKLGDDSLFPDSKPLKHEEKLPTISMNNGK